MVREHGTAGEALQGFVCDRTGFPGPNGSTVGTKEPIILYHTSYSNVYLYSSCSD
jgi:hypothetical protein